jgi:membrane protease subunit HflK
LGDVLPQARQQIIVDDTIQQILPMLPFPAKTVEEQK